MTDQNDQTPLEHTERGTTTRDAVDVGVPMAPPPPDVPQVVGPEDAADPGPKRGDYSARMPAGESVSLEPIPLAEQVPGGPKVRQVRQGPVPEPPAAA